MQRSADSQNQIMALKPEQIFEILIKRKWLIIIPLCICLTIGLFVTLTSKKTYQASTLILIQPQKVPIGYIKSVVSTDLNQRLSTISQQILSRSNLEKIINQYGLFQDPNQKGMYLEDKIASMRKRINVKIEQGRKTNAQAFSVSFKGSQPERIMRISNALASFFMDENLKVREAQAIGTSEFLQSELAKIKGTLEEKEYLLSQFRAKYLGGLPDELESNLRTLDRLQLQLSDKLGALRDIKNSLNLLNSEISRRMQIQDNLTGSVQVDESGNVQIVQSESEQLYFIEKSKLDALLLKYTNKHPEVKKLTKSVAKLKDKVELEAKEKKETPENTSKTAKTPSNVKTDETLFKQQLYLKQLNNEITRTELEIAQIKNNMSVYQKRVEGTPAREQELQALQRDYNNINGMYNSLLDRQLESQIAVNMEKKQKGEQFRILDHARIPEKPISPDIRILFLLSLALGLGIGGGITFLLEFLDTSIKRVELIETQFGLPVLATIPSILDPGKKAKNKVEILFFSLFTLYTIAALACFAIINSIGLDKTTNFIKTQLNI